MALEDELNARLRHLSEEIRAFRKNIDQLRRRDPLPPTSTANEMPRVSHKPPSSPQKRRPK